LAYKPKPHQQPGWSIKGNLSVAIPNEMCQWEKFLLAENIADEEIGNNDKVEAFIRKNADTFYIPTTVLKAYGMNWE